MYLANMEQWSMASMKKDGMSAIRSRWQSIPTHVSVAAELPTLVVNVVHNAFRKAFKCWVM